MASDAAFSPACAPAVRGLEPYVPGKPLSDLEREFGITDSIKLASNENPLGPSPAALEAMARAARDVGLYPDGGAVALRQAIGARHGIEPGQVTVGNGSNDILVLLAETFLAPGDEAVYAQYGFLVYGLAVQATGARARVVPALPSDRPMALGHDLAAMARAVGPATRLVFIANPNNPTGTWCGQDELRTFLQAVPRDVIVVLDEAYAEYVASPDYPDTVPWLHEFPNLVLTRTFSKAHGLAGLRVGYALSHSAIAELLNRVRQPFNVNALAQAAAIASLGDETHVRRSRELNAAGLRQLRTGLEALGFRCFPSAANFLLADTGGPAAPWYDGLLRRGVIVRPVGNYGLPDCLRITVGLPAQVERLLHALAGLRAR